MSLKLFTGLLSAYPSEVVDRVRTDLPSAHRVELEPSAFMSIFSADGHLVMRVAQSYFASKYVVGWRSEGPVDYSGLVYIATQIVTRCILGHFVVKDGHYRIPAKAIADLEAWICVHTDEKFVLKPDESWDR